MTAEVVPVNVNAVAEAELPAPPDGWTPPTSNSITFRLIELSRLIDQGTEEAIQLDEDWVECKQRHEVAWARAILSSSETSEAKRKADAILQCEDLKLEMEIRHQLLRGCESRLKTLKEQMRIGQSLGAAARADWAASNWMQQGDPR